MRPSIDYAENQKEGTRNCLPAATKKNQEQSNGGARIAYRRSGLTGPFCDLKLENVRDTNAPPWTRHGCYIVLLS